MKKILVICFCFILIGCSFGKVSGNEFQKEFEKYNDSYLKLDLKNVNAFKFSSFDEVNQIFSNGSGVILFGKSNDDLTRKVVQVLINVVDNTGIDTIYYLDSFDDIILNEDIPLDMPVVMFVVDGKVLSYHVGTINDKVDLTEDEEISLYNIYLNGVHDVLQDACDEDC